MHVLAKDGHDRETRADRLRCDSIYMKKENTVLNNLIETLKDGQEGFKQAAEGVSNPNLKSAITGGDEHAILAECERGEDSAVEEYKKALEDALTPSAQDLVSRQFAEIKSAHDRIRSLRDAAES